MASRLLSVCAASEGSLPVSDCIWVFPKNIGTCVPILGSCYSTCLYINTHTLYIYIYICMCIYICIYMYLDTCQNTYLYVYSYIHMYEYAYTYIYTCICILCSKIWGTVVWANLHIPVHQAACTQIPNGLGPTCLAHTCMLPSVFIHTSTCSSLHACKSVCTCECTSFVHLHMGCCPRLAPQSILQTVRKTISMLPKRPTLQRDPTQLLHSPADNKLYI